MNLFMKIRKNNYHLNLFTRSLPKKFSKRGVTSAKTKKSKTSLPFEIILESSINQIKEVVQKMRGIG